MPFKIVDCYRPDIVEQTRGCSALMWHWAHNDPKAALFARQLTLSLEKRGMVVFPDSATSWHYDDKVGQKYLLEAIGAPLVPTWVFYRAEEALRWAETTTYPKVFKLRGGAGSMNVHLVRSLGEARGLIHRSFGAGWSAAGSPWAPIRERLWHIRRDRTMRSVLDVGRGIYRAVWPHPNYRNGPMQKGYAYFQEFLPGNSYDLRIIVIGHRAFGIKRMVREGDFRASGSGKLVHDPASISLECLKAAFAVKDTLGAQSVAFDFMFRNDIPLIGEISYAFALNGYRDCQGWWDQDLNWHEGRFRPEEFMIEDVLARVEGQN
ncbi:RimK family alpha-L-glutamate ligase [Brevundimonas vesicularis]|uniref:ATP-grasp domain-containing protein n=1 Tax=Brevundimonas vesicularis TaxID=41276 RepID=UPI00384E0328